MTLRATVLSVSPLQRLPLLLTRPTWGRYRYRKPVSSGTGYGYRHKNMKNQSSPKYAQSLWCDKCLYFIMDPLIRNIHLNGCTEIHKSVRSCTILMLQNLIFEMPYIFLVLISTKAISQIARFMGPTWGPPGSYRPQMAPCWPHEPCYQGQFNTNDE